MLNNSIKLFNRAKNIIPGGVNSPVRAFLEVNSPPPFIQKANGPYLSDIDNNQYIDYVCSWGAIILGHNHPTMQQALQKSIQQGTSFGAPTSIEVELAELICELMPSIEMIRMVNSGTEATMSAIRLARGATGKSKIIKFQGCYHGHADSLLIKGGSGLLTFGTPSSQGIPPELVQHTLVAPYADLDTTEKLFQQHASDIAAIIVEPIAGNMNLQIPPASFLKGLRELCDQYQSLLIFDEVITGFRVALGGAQEHFQVKPDLTCLGKIIGGGLPVGAFGGKKELLSHLAPLGPVYQAGTLSGNPLAMTAGFTALTLIKQQANSLYDHLSSLSTQLTQGLSELAEKYQISLKTQQIGGLFGIEFSNDHNHALFQSFFQSLLNNGIYLAPSPFEAGFLSLAHTKEHIDKTLQCAEQAFSTIKESVFS